MAKNKDSASYGIIGLGRFGTALAKSLAAAGKDVMIIDSSEAKVRELRQYTEHAFVAHDLGRDLQNGNNTEPYPAIHKYYPATMREMPLDHPQN